MRILPDNGFIANGKIWLDGQEIVSLSEKEVKELRWRKVSMIFQNALNAFNPILRVGDRIAEVIQEKEGCTKDLAYKRVKNSSKKLN